MRQIQLRIADKLVPVETHYIGISTPLAGETIELAVSSGHALVATADVQRFELFEPILGYWQKFKGVLVQAEEMQSPATGRCYCLLKIEVHSTEPAPSAQPV